MLKTRSMVRCAGQPSRIPVLRPESGRSRSPALDPAEDERRGVADVLQGNDTHARRIDEVAAGWHQCDAHTDGDEVQLRCDSTHLLHDPRLKAGLLAQVMGQAEGRAPAGTRHHDEIFAGERLHRHRLAPRERMVAGHRHAQAAGLNAEPVQHRLVLHQVCGTALAQHRGTRAEVHETSLDLARCERFRLRGAGRLDQRKRHVGIGLTELLDCDTEQRMEQRE
jgi:hypothetical protein